jgi:hypothetical protein
MKIETRQFSDWIKARKKIIRIEVTDKGWNRGVANGDNDEYLYFLFADNVQRFT